MIRNVACQPSWAGNEITASASAGGGQGLSSKNEKWPLVMAIALIVSVFFEGSGYSFQVLGMRVRYVQVFEVLFLGFITALFLFGKWRWRRSPLDYWLLAYLAVNLVAIVNSQWQARSVKIFLLLVSLALLYWLVVQLLRDKNDILLAFYVFLAMGTLQVLFGLYQVLAGALNYYRGWSLPIGHMGMVHREYINSVWGRPYGTQVEPDFYGAICMVLALIFIILYFSESGGEKKWLLAGMLLSLLGLFFSFVRICWFIFLLALPLLALARRKLSFFRFTWLLALFIMGGVVGTAFIAAYSVSPIARICQARFATKESADMKKNAFMGKGRSLKKNRVSLLKRKYENVSLLNDKNIRLFTMRVSLRTWSEHPVIGNGPGSFAYVFWRSVFDEEKAQKFIAEGYLPWTNPSIFFSILGDTGLLGLFIFLAMVAKFIFACRAKLAGPPTPLAAPAFALAVGLTALFLSYMLTNGLWLPLTWVFLALAVASLRQFPAPGGDRQADARGA